MASGRILLVGRNGQLGHELLRTLAPLGEVIALDRAALDLGDESAIRAALRRLRPSLVVNAAAYTAVDQAESQTDLAFAINARAPAVLAQEAAALGARLIHYSTDYVFAGDKPQGAYAETDPTGPINAYGRSKLAGEQAIAAVGGEHLILRTSWVYGAHGANFVKTVIRLARERETLSIVADQIGAPTSSRLIAEATAVLAMQLASRGDAVPGGIYHLQAAGETSWYEFAGHIVERLRAADAQSVRCREIVPILAAAYPTPARRPANSRLDCARIVLGFGLRLPHWRDDFGRHFAEILRG